MNRKKASLKKSGTARLTEGKTTLQAEELVNATVGAAVGGIVAGPAGVILGGLTGAMIDTRPVNQEKLSSSAKDKRKEKARKPRVRRPQATASKKHRSGTRAHNPNARKRKA